MKLSPYGMKTCCICDKETTHALDSEDGTWLPYCAECAKATKDRWPETRVVIWSG